MDEAKGADMTDQEIVLQAIHEVRVMLGLYIGPEPRDCESALNSILGVMDHGELVTALKRLDHRNAIQLVSIDTGRKGHWTCGAVDLKSSHAYR